ncbi:MAG TPA: S-layer homology domain-containing protein [Bacillota bacterium]|jgi:chromosome segregation ATPase|nr:hypothetical protein [Bacillota bacterium]HOA91572.1 S-layer homology domain-containing protein [Bacillota bacterium]HPT61074.1 S-layer homology domain-containing protein [Bacillota bacterium]HPZ73527.1 S-layer homology domain-containing protein [Bacillota bacterium]HQD78820.1 S-layer homology domain-containing protein [Bacillota bacterium]
MKLLPKRILTLLVAFTLAISALAATVTDVPSTHWAYQSVIELLDKGYLSAYPDNTFRGGEPVDRYTLASIVARILREVQTGKVATSPEDITTLTKLYQEFHKELSQFVLEFNEAKNKISELEKTIIVTKDEITRLQIDYNSFKPEIAKQIEAVFKSMNDIKLALERQIADVTTMLTTLSDDKASSEAVELAITKAIQMSSNETLKEQENLKSEMTSELVALRLDLDEATKRLEEEVNALKTSLAMSGQNIDELVKKSESISTESSQKIQELQQELASLRNELQTLEDEVVRIAGLEKQLEQAKQQIAALEIQLRDELLTNISTGFVRERTIENRLDKLEAQLASVTESSDARLLALEKGRNFWWAGFGLSLVAIIVSIVSFTK